MVIHKLESTNIIASSSKVNYIANQAFLNMGTTVGVVYSLLISYYINTERCTSSDIDIVYDLSNIQGDSKLDIVKNKLKQLEELDIKYPLHIIDNILTDKINNYLKYSFESQLDIDSITMDFEELAKHLLKEPGYKPGLDIIVNFILDYFTLNFSKKENLKRYLEDNHSDYNEGTYLIQIPSLIKVPIAYLRQGIEKNSTGINVLGICSLISDIETRLHKVDTNSMLYKPLKELEDNSVDFQNLGYMEIYYTGISKFESYTGFVVSKTINNEYLLEL